MRPASGLGVMFLPGHADPGCDAWKNCNENCFNENDTVACYDGCDQSFPHNEALSETLLECTCDACGNLCVAACT